MKRLQIQNFAQIENVDIRFGDLTLITGPQATGKSLFLQWVKLANDAAEVLSDFKQYGLGWSSPESFLDAYFGSGYGSSWSETKTKIHVDAKLKTLPQLLKSRTRKNKLDGVYYIPAHRSLLMGDGWPRPFHQYFSDTPYVARQCSELLRTLLVSDEGNKQLFPEDRRFKKDLRAMIDGAIFHGASLQQSLDKGRQQLTLRIDDHSQTPQGKNRQTIAYMGWTAGQREFIPLQLAMYELLPRAAKPKLSHIDHVILEEPEMGLHPNAIMVTLCLVADLLQRGYKVTLSTHSPLIVAAVWALEQLQHCKADEATYINLLQMPPSFRQQATTLGQTKIRAYYLDYNASGRVVSRDISKLDPNSNDAIEAGWGGLSSTAGHLTQVVAQEMNRARARHKQFKPTGGDL
ncbi:MAG: AAA family ATPase [Cytophagales bacterium]|nr:AAA family ATPase [Cytophagales bacterium]